MRKILELYQTENGYVFLKAGRSGRSEDNLGKSWIVADETQLEEVFALIKEDMGGSPGA